MILKKYLDKTTIFCDQITEHSLFRPNHKQVSARFSFKL